MVYKATPAAPQRRFRSPPARPSPPCAHRGSLNQAVEVAVQVRGEDVQVKGVYVSLQEVDHLLDPRSRAEDPIRGYSPMTAAGATGPLKQLLKRRRVKLGIAQNSLKGFQLLHLLQDLCGGTFSQ